MKRAWYVPVLVALCVVGAISQDDRSDAPQAPTQSDSVAPTNVLGGESETLVGPPTSCYEEYYAVADDTLNKLPEAINLALVDALIERYDVPARRLPYECGSAELLDKTDIAIRLALGAQRTAIMTDDVQYAAEAQANAEDARSYLEAWIRE